MDPIQIIVSFIIGMLGKYPFFASVLFIMGVCRAVFKPLTAVARAYVQSTPSTKDDAKLDEIEHSKTYILIGKILDYATSIKLPGIK